MNLVPVYSFAACIVAATLVATPVAAAPFLADGFYSLAISSRALCTLEASHARLTGDATSFEKCLTKEESDIAGFFKRTMHDTKSNTAKAEVKKFYAAWLTAMSGLESLPGETETSYSARQDQADHELEELGNTMKVEALSD